MASSDQRPLVFNDDVRFAEAAAVRRDVHRARCFVSVYGDEFVDFPCSAQAS